MTTTETQEILREIRDSLAAIRAALPTAGPVPGRCPDCGRDAEVCDDAPAPR